MSSYGYRVLFHNIQGEIVQELRAAKQSITVAVAWFTDAVLFEELRQAQARGVRICLLINDDDINQNGGLPFGELAAKGALVYLYPSLQLMHNKYCLIDERVLIMGSYNWTFRAANYNQESIVIFSDNAPIAEFEANFEQLRSVATLHPDSKNPVNEPFVGHGILDPRKMLRAEIVTLEAEIAALTEHKVGLENVVSTFERMLRHAIGDLLLIFWELQERLAKIKADLTAKRSDEVQLQTVKSQHEAYREQYTQQANAPTNDEAAENLPPNFSEADFKKMYKEAVMMSHPDRFATQPELHAEANRITAMLTEAYKNRDYETLAFIYEALKNGTAFKIAPENIDDVAQLHAILAQLQQTLATLKADIAQLESNEAYKISLQNTDLSVYFEAARQDVEGKIKILKTEISQYAAKVN